MNTKVIVNLYILILSLGTLFSLYIPQTEVVADEPLVIPSEAIRLRILANSDMEEDQAIKRKVRDEVNKHITEWVSDLTSIEEARTLIKSKLPEVQEIAERVVKEEGSNQSVKTDFNKVDFPTKLYGQFLYPAGEYEAILITLGDGDGANWWCVLFPPLCFLDFSNGVAVSDGFEEEPKEQEEKLAVQDEEKESKQEKDNEENPVYTGEDEEEVEVKFFLVELWEKIFG
ncbi:stage II sporulation protein R [Cytobacillus horneckiae]|uniref:Stage II sporulation protein R n=1 Tax=Cytobacillus horneckiae TaxID=549687 RepID=A0A2N0ZFZ8_9BACI|nr:stage II sporulation protein R [Cytobacillus horneckiae]MBN6885029.1 stage II sporulation protein R [Cytobacillus horneckiae]MCM3179225.1 stage II sporulation protein R [Cytobacillus horneckiae]MEC1154447.1 stage II sporulation protein R [Cytobacillus horneckiae]MED2937782.1 stage II sporulation protein R [Cytobacillus horneckiae]PKG28429.1 stage II sporulation protein R [Cytobacillus horneckiae]